MCIRDRSERADEALIQRRTVDRPWVEEHTAAEARVASTSGVDRAAELHAARVAEHAARVAEHAARVAEHAARVAEHAARVAEHAGRAALRVEQAPDAVEAPKASVVAAVLRVEKEQTS